MQIISKKNERPLIDELAEKNLSRRKFLRFTGLVGLTTTAIATGCNKNDSDDGLNLGSGDTGILNYAYALEQLEAAFYIQVASAFYAGITDAEKSLLTDIRDHEIAHRELFKAALSTDAIPALEVDFSSVNFSSRDSVLGAAKSFEDLGVSAYNGAGGLLTTPANLILAGKIVSVEARHAALIRDRISNGTFVGPDVIDMATATEISRTPRQVLAIAGPYIKTKINANNLPS